MVSLARLYLLLGPSGKDYRENSNLGKGSIEKKRFLSGIARMMGGAQCIGRRTFSLISHGIKNNFFALIIKNEVILQ